MSAFCCFVLLYVSEDFIHKSPGYSAICAAYFRMCDLFWNTGTEAQVVCLQNCGSTRFLTGSSVVNLHYTGGRNTNLLLFCAKTLCFFLHISAI